MKLQLSQCYLDPLSIWYQRRFFYPCTNFLKCPSLQSDLLRRTSNRFSILFPGHFHPVLFSHHNPVSIPCESCFDSLWGSSRHLLLPLENMFSQKALLTQVIQCRVGPTCYSRQVPNMNWKYGYMHGLRLRWIRNFLRWDSEWNPDLQTTEKIRHNTVQSARRRHKMNLGCQLNSLCSYSTCLLEY